MLPWTVWRFCPLPWSPWHVHIAIRPEGQGAAVVVELGLVDFHQHADRTGVYDVLACGQLPFGDHTLVVHLVGRQVDGEIGRPLSRFARVRIDLVITRTVRIGEIRVEGEAEQAAFIIIVGIEAAEKSELDQATADIQQGLGSDLSLVDYLNQTRLVHDIESVRILRTGHKIDRCRQSGSHGFQSDPDWGRADLLDKRRSGHCEITPHGERVGPAAITGVVSGLKHGLI